MNNRETERKEKSNFKNQIHPKNFMSFKRIITLNLFCMKPRVYDGIENYVGYHAQELSIYARYVFLY